jgi:hypothetical protein
MAGDWIKAGKSLHNRPEILRLASVFGWSRDEAVGVMLRFWFWLDDAVVDADVDAVVDGLEANDVDKVMSCPGFAMALQSVGWLRIEADPRRLVVPNFGRHNGETAKKRALKNERQAHWRAGKTPKSVDAAPSTREEKRRDTSLRSVVGARVTRIPIDWQPSPVDLAFAKERLRADAVAGQVEAFRNYWQGAVRNATSPDWSAKWRTWVGKAARDFGVPAGGAAAVDEWRKAL